MRRHQINHEDQEKSVIPPFRVRRGRRPFVVAAVRRDSLPDRRRSSEHGRNGLGIAPAPDDTGRDFDLGKWKGGKVEGWKSAGRDAELALRARNKCADARRAEDVAPYRADERDFERAFQGGAGLPPRGGSQYAKRRGRSETAARGAENPCLRVERSNTGLQNPAGWPSRRNPGPAKGSAATRGDRRDGDLA